MPKTARDNLVSAVPDLKQRVLLAQLFLDLSKGMHEAYSPIASGSAAGWLDGIAVLSAVLVGTVEGRGVTASAISRKLGMSHSTVARRLKVLSAAGLIGRLGNVYVVLPEPLAAAPQRAAAARMYQQIIRISENLLRLGEVYRAQQSPPLQWLAQQA